MMAMVKNVMKKMVGFLTAAVTTVSMAAFIPGNVSATETVSHTELCSMANEVAILVNEARAELGLSEVYVVPYLNDIAMERSEEIVESFSHTRPDGTKFSTLIDKSVVPYTYAAENIAAGSSTADTVFEQWRDSASHWKAITSEKITHMGIGVAYDPDGEYVWYWTQIFVKTNKEYEDQYLPTEYEIVPKMEGDLNGDGVIDTYDYLVLADYVYKKKIGEAVYLNKEQLEAADCFHDGLITESDAKVIMRYLIGEYKTVHFEF